MWIDFSEWANKVKIFAFHVKVHQRLISAEEESNNQVDRITLSAKYRSGSLPSQSCHFPKGS